MANITQSILNSIRNKYQGIRSKMTDEEGWFRGNKFTPLKQIETTIPGGFEGARQRLRQTSWKQYTPMQMGPDAVRGAEMLGTAFGNRQAGQDVGHFFKGATNLTPWGMASKQFNKEQEALVAPTTQRQKNIQKLGESAYGIALTAPLGGGNIVRNIGSRAIQGTLLGTGMKLGGNILSGEKWNKDLEQGAISGLQNSWKLAITNSITDKVLSKILPSLTSASLDTGSKLLKEAVSKGSPEVRKIFVNNAIKLFGRALSEVPAENTFYVAFDKLSGEEKRRFVDAWWQELPGNVLGNLAFAGLQVGKQGAYDLNKPQIDAAAEAFIKTAKNFFGDGFQLRPAKTNLLTAVGPEKIEIEPSVVQIVDTKTGEVQYKTIPKGELETYKKLIDDTQTGIAGETIDGKRYHLTAKTPEAMNKVGAKFTGTANVDEIPVKTEEILPQKTITTSSGLVIKVPNEPLGSKVTTQGEIVNPRASSEVPEANLLDQTTKTTLGEQPKIEQPTKIDTEPLKDVKGRKIPTQQSQKIKQRVQELDSLGPVEKIIAALKGAKTLNPEQQKLYSAGRKQQYSRIAKARATTSGESGYFAQLGAAKGELEKVEFESLRNSLKQKDIDSLFNSIKTSQLAFWEKLNAGTGLEKLLGKRGGKLPTKSEIQLLDEVFGKDFTEALLSKRDFMAKLTDNMKDAINVPRALMASVDLSAPFRQGVFLIGHPKQFFSSFGAMIKSFGSEKAYNETIADISQRPTYQLMRENKLAITRPDSRLSQGEESFMSNFAEKIPGIGRLVKASDRAYSGFLNKLRADVFDELFYKAKDLGIEATPKMTGDLADFVNTATGRGKLPGGIDRISEIVNGIFFSPKLMFSRLHLLNPAYYAKLDPFVRKEALKSLLTFSGVALTTISLASLAGAETEGDPRSTDFGKIKIGNTRYDPWGGFQQYVRLAAQLITGQTKSTAGGEVRTLGEGYKARTRFDIASEFLQNKEAPVASFVTSMLKGQDNFGNKFNLPTEVLDRLTPMMIQDLYDLQKEWGPKGYLMGIPGLFGVGSQTYGTQVPNMETSESGKPSIKFKNANSLSEDIVSKFTGKPESNIPVEQQKQYLDAREREQQISLLKSQTKQGKVEAGSDISNFYSYVQDGTVKIVDVGKYDSMPEDSAYQRAIKEQKKYTLVDDILDNLEPEQQAQALAQLGISAEEATYYNVAKQTNAIKGVFVEEEIRRLIENGANKNDVLAQMAKWRKSINGKILLSNGMIDDLVDNSIISYADGKLLKQIESGNEGRLKVKSSGGAKKGKKISVSVKKVTPIKATYTPMKLQVKKKVAKKTSQPMRVKLNFTTPKTLL